MLFKRLLLIELRRVLFPIFLEKSLYGFFPLFRSADMQRKRDHMGLKSPTAVRAIHPPHFSCRSTGWAFIHNNILAKRAS
jgi:hypothetical protein